MKKVLILLIVIAGVYSCKQPEVRYSQSSAEVDSWNQVIADYEAGDWEALRMHYSDTAKIYRNSTEAMSPDELVATHQETLANYSSYGFVEGEGDAEMVVTDEGDVWVNFWGTWKGTMKANNKEYTIPVHVTSQYVDGKIVRAHDYWDGSEIMMDMQAMEAAAAENMAEESEE